MKAADSVLTPTATHFAESAQPLAVGGFLAPAAAAALPEVTGSAVAQTSAHLALVSRFLHRNSCFLEVGTSDCELSLAVANRVRSVYAVAHSSRLTVSRRLPAHFHLVPAEHAAVPVPQGSVDVAYSSGFVDHLTPEEIAEHFASVRRALTRGGVFVCFAENRLLLGDRMFARADRDSAPPYTFCELRRLLRQAGFRRTVQYLRFAGASVRVRGALASMIESAGRAFPIQLVATN
ncbi:MAG TPA: class I SAM-dependent methyltransferase [Steroidobacteraceae bacterium]|jgi:SAM-dependent methyltransferase